MEKTWPQNQAVVDQNKDQATSSNVKVSNE